MYIGLLRGINVSGKNKIVMKELREELENNGYRNVKTYLNSGNIIFNSDKKDICTDIHNIILSKFNIDIPVYITTTKELEKVIDNAPIWWDNGNKDIYNNIIFIIPPITYNEVYNKLGDPNIYDKVYDYNNFIFWSYDLNNYKKSRWWKMSASCDIKNSITIRTSNTIKKLLELSRRDNE